MPAEPFPAVKRRFDALVQDVFPNARRGTFAGIAGWSVPRPPRAPRYQGGTMPGDVLILGLADRKAGPTAYIWLSSPEAGLEARRSQLEAAGFKVMVGCLVFTKKQPYPFDALEELFRAIKAKEDAYV